MTDITDTENITPEDTETAPAPPRTAYTPAEVDEPDTGDLDAAEAAFGVTRPTTEPRPTLPGGGRGGSSDEQLVYFLREGAERALQRPDWHRHVRQDDIVTAWEEVASTAAALEAAVVAISTVTRERFAAESEHLAKVTAAASAGKPAPKAPTPKDWARVHGERRATAQGLAQGLLAARARYDHLVAGAELDAGLLDAWRPAVEAALAAVEAARESVAGAVEVREAAVASALTAGDVEVAPQPVGWSTVVSDLEQSERAIRAAGAVESLVLPAITPSRREREQMANSGSFPILVHLGRVERSEGYKVTRHTWGMGLPLGPDLD